MRSDVHPYGSLFRCVEVPKMLPGTMRSIACVCGMIVVLSLAWAQEKALRPHLELGAGINMLTSPGTGIRSGVGGSAHMAAGLSLDAGILSFHPRAMLSTAGFRTHMERGTHFVSQRSALDLEFAVGYRLPKGAVIMAGILAGTVLEANTMVEQRFGNVVRGNTAATIHPAQLASSRRAGVLFGALLPLDRPKRWALCIRLRQHLLPLVQEHQYQGLPNGKDYWVLADNTRPTELLLGLGFWFR